MKNILLIFLLSITITATAQNKFRQPVNMYDTLRLFKGASPGKILQCVTDSGSCAWVPMPSSGGGWSLTGNSGTDPATNFIGTSDGTAITIKSDQNFNHNEDSTVIGNTGIGSISFNSNLLGLGDGYMLNSSEDGNMAFVYGTKKTSFFNGAGMISGVSTSDLGQGAYASFFYDSTTQYYKGTISVTNGDLITQFGANEQRAELEAGTLEYNSDLHLYGHNWDFYCTTQTTSSAIFGDTLGIGIINAEDTIITVYAGKLKYTDGTQGTSKVLTSDATGAATWEATAQSNGTYTTPALAAIALGSGKPYILSTTIGAVAVLLQAITP